MSTIWTGQWSLVLARPRYVCTLLLPAGTAKSVNVPSWANVVLFGSTVGTDYYVGYGVAASVPTSDILDGSGHELNPLVRFVTGVSYLSVVSPGGGVVTLSFFA